MKIEKALQDEIVTESGIKFFIDPSFNKNWQSTVTATIEALPQKISPQDKQVISNLKVGDEVAISYQVVSDFDFGSDNLRFMPCTEDNPLLKEFINGRGQKLLVAALPSRRGISDKIWAGVLQDKYGNVLDGKQGTESEVDRWFAQFPIGKTDVYTFNNFFEFEGKDYWKCPPSQIFAKKVKNHIVAVGNRVICIPIDLDLPEEFLSRINTQGKKVQARLGDRARVLSSASKKFKKDQIVGFDFNKCEKYEFWGKQYYMIREDLVKCLWKMDSNV